MVVSFHNGLKSAIAIGLLSILATSGQAQQAAVERFAADADPVAACSAMLGSRFQDIPGAPTEIYSASVRSMPGAPEFCELFGYIAPQITITVRLPTRQWNGKFFHSGCGAMCGTPVRPGLYFDEALSRGYAVVASDMGHHSGGTAGTEGLWAHNNLMAKLDFGFRATHVTTIVGKHIVATYYGKPHRYSYFRGCSTGGRQGLLSAQRYPDDFDGIISGAPVNIYGTGAFQQVWSALANRDADDKSIMKRRDIEFLHKSAVASCDAADGLKDGLIEDPRKCKFEPGELVCKAGQTENCLTPSMVEVARKVYSGPVNSKGLKIHAGAPEIGSEMSWISSSFDDGDRPGALYSFGMQKVRYVVLSEGPSFKPTDIDWDQDPERARGLDSIYAATNPDLRKFKERGGKLLQYHGWNDETAVPRNSIDYYEMATRTMGGPDATKEFYRLFMIPGLNHCSTGRTAAQVDYLTALENWVEKGQAPDMLYGEFVERGEVVFSRPHFPYPDVARYVGKGDVNKAENFRRFTPK